MKAGEWTWLEVARLTANLLVPLTIAALGIYVHRVTKRFEHLQWRSQKLIEKRLDIFDDLAPQFNDLLCYFTYVGCWRELDPPDVVALKRKIDKKIHLAAPLFSRDFFMKCTNFQSLCFETYTGWGRDARLRTPMERRKEARGESWKSEWDTCFSAETTEPTKVFAAYRNVMEVFAREIGVHTDFVIPSAVRAPVNVR